MERIAWAGVRGEAGRARCGSGKKRLASLLITSTVLCSAGLFVPVIAHAQQSATQVVSFDIPAQPLAASINAFIRASGWDVGFTSKAVAGKRSSPVKGSMTPAAALQAMLAGTGVSARVSGPTTAALVANSGDNTQVAADGSLVLETIDVQGSAETATSPVDGYVATVSGTGTKMDAKLIETPQSISVIGRQEMEDRGVQSLGDAIRYTPSLKANLNGNVDNGVDVYTLRGFTFWSASNYLDGLYNDGWIEPYGTERIEVLRGPASVLYGQSNPGGLISAVSKRPTEETIREVGILTSQYGGIQGSFDFGGKLTEDGQFLYRLTGLGKNLGTQFDNGSEYQRVYIAPSVTWKPDADTTLTILAKYQYDPHLLSANSVPALGTLEPRSDGIHIPSDFYVSDPSYDKGSYRRQAAIGYAFEHRFNDVWTVRQNLRYQESTLNREYLTMWCDDGVPTCSRYAQHQYEQKSIFGVDTNAEAKFNTGPISHAALFGVDYRNITNWSRAGYGSTATVPDINLLNPVYGIFSGPAGEFSEGSDQKSWQLGLYAQDQIKWDRWTLMLGGRYDWAASKTHNPFNSGALTDEMDQHAFTKRIGLVYQFDNGIAPYISYADSFEPQSGTSSPARGSQAFEPTTGRQYEVGIKYQPSFFDGFFTVALYDLRKQNVTTTDPDNDAYSVQTGEVASRGIEFTGVANITSDLRFTGAFGYVDNKVTKDNPNYAGVSTVGKSTYGVPAYTASAWLDYTFSTGALEGLGLGGGVRYIGKSPGDSQNTFYVPGVTLFDAAVRYDFGKKFPDLKGLQLSVNATNLFDKEYIATCYGTTICNYGSRRTVTGALTYRW